MSTRLRSAAGSFVRSPKGAFDTGAPVVAGVINVAIGSGQYAYMQALTPTPAQCLINLASPGIRDVLTIQFLAGSAWTDDQLANGTYTGFTSGVSWSPATDWGIAYHCDYLSSALPRVYVGGGVLDVFGDGTRISHEYYTETEVDDPQLTRATWNRGQFPGGFLPGFVNAEDFSFVPG